MGPSTTSEMIYSTITPATPTSIIISLPSASTTKTSTPPEGNAGNGVSTVLVASVISAVMVVTVVVILILVVIVLVCRRWYKTTNGNHTISVTTANLDQQSHDGNVV